MNSELTFENSQQPNAAPPRIKISQHATKCVIMQNEYGKMNIELTFKNLQQPNAAPLHIKMIQHATKFAIMQNSYRAYL